MKKWFPLVWFVCFGLSPFSLRSSLAQATPSAPAPSLAQSLEKLRKVDEELIKKVEDVRTTVDAEFAAKRISEPIAQSLRWTLNNAKMTPTAEFSKINGSRFLTLDNKLLIERLQQLEVDWGAAQTDRQALIKVAGSAAREQLADVLWSASKPSDLDTLRSSVDRLLEIALTRSNDATLIAINANDVQYFPTVLRALRELLEAQEKTDPNALGTALGQFQNSISAVRSVIKESDAQQRIQQVMTPYSRGLDDAQDKLDQLLRDRRSAEEYTAGFVALEKAVERYQQVRGTITVRPVRDTNQLVGVYRNLGVVAGALEKGDFVAAKSNLNNLRDSVLQHLGAAKAAAYGTLVAGWAKTIEEGLQQAQAKRREALRARFGAVKNPADLEAFSVELFKSANELRENRDGEVPRGLATQLGTMAAAWSAGNPMPLARQNYGDDSDPRFAAELGALRHRIERDLLGRSLRVPEINQPPLTELPLEVAIDKISDQLATRGEWRRLLQVTEGRRAWARFEGGMPAVSDLSNALRAYLTAQNLELAEQWGDAIHSYKAVLRSTNERAPIKEAADRVKILSREHPEAGTAPLVPNPTQAPTE